MKNLHILLLEDNIEDAQKIANLLFDKYVLTIANTVESAKNVVQNIKFDLAILDISLEGRLDGIDFAKYLKDNQYAFPFLFLTSMQGKDVFSMAKMNKPYTYILKPFNEIELQYTIELAIEKYFEQENTLRLQPKNAVLHSDYLFVKKHDRICKLKTEDIEYVAVEENYCTLFTASERYVVKLSLTRIKEMLSNKNFEQIHRKHLVNLAQVKEFNLKESTAYLYSGTPVSISERYKKHLSNMQNILK